MTDYLTKYDKHCLTCIHYDLDEDYKKSNRFGYACDHYYRQMAFDESCKAHYQKDPLRTNEEILKAVKERMKWGYAGIPDNQHWYLITAFNKIFGQEADSNYIKSGIKLRKYAEKMGFNELLYYYDKYGYQLSIILLTEYYNDKNNFDKLDNTIKEEFIDNTKEYFLDPIVYFVENNMYDLAITKMEELVSYLMSYYHINFIRDYEDKEYEVPSLNLNYDVEPVYSLDNTKRLIKKKNTTENSKFDINLTK